MYNKSPRYTQKVSLPVRLQKYFDVYKYFLKDMDSMEDLLEECRKTQVYLGEIIFLKAEIGKEYSNSVRKLEHQTEMYRDMVFDSLKKRAISTTESIVRAKVEYLYGDTLQELREKRDDLKIEYECIHDIYYAMMQRKDILVQIIDRWKFKDEYEACILKNSEFINYIKRG